MIDLGKTGKRMKQRNGRELIGLRMDARIFMRGFRYLFLGVCVSLAACSNTPNVTQPTSSDPANYSASTEIVPTVTPNPLSGGETLLKTLPNCDGIKILEGPIKFEWPNIDLRIKELEGSVWGYYRCPGSQKEVAAFYRQQMPKARPTLYYETNWVERKEGSVGVYYDGVNWIYLWVVPQPDNTQMSYVIVSQSNVPVIGDCIAASFHTISQISPAEGQWSLE
jgi:hypothetical protein